MATEPIADETTLRAPWSGRDGWHVADWGPWGWAETAVKLVAITIAVVAALADARAAVPADHRLTYWLVVAAAVGYLFAVVDRLQDREIVAMGFVFAMIVGHWALVLAMGRSADDNGDWPATVVRSVLGLLLLGDLIKIGYFVATGAQVRDLPRFLPIVMTSSLALLYLVALLAA